MFLDLFILKIHQMKRMICPSLGGRGVRQLIACKRPGTALGTQRPPRNLNLVSLANSQDDQAERQCPLDSLLCCFKRGKNRRTQSRGEYGRVLFKRGTGGNVPSTCQSPQDIGMSRVGEMHSLSYNSPSPSELQDPAQLLILLFLEAFLSASTEGS